MKPSTETAEANGHETTESGRSLIRVGALCYNLCASTRDLLNRVAGLPGVSVRAYALQHLDDNSERLLCAVAEFGKRRRHIQMKSGSTLERLMLSPGVRVVRQCLAESDCVLMLGLLGFPGLTASLLARVYRRPLAVAVQCLAPDKERKRSILIRSAKRIVLSPQHDYLAQTPPTSETLMSLYGIPRERIFDAPFASGALQFREFLQAAGDRLTARRSLGIADDEFVVLFVGTLYHLKGVDTLVEAATLIQRRPLRIVISGRDAVGTGYQGGLAETARRLNVSQLIQFTGYVPTAQISRMYLAADAFALPTRKDTWPKVLVEAAIAGLPLVTTSACGSAGALVKDEFNGYVVAPGDARALAGAIDRIAASPALRAKMADRTREMVKQFIDQERELNAYAEFAERVRASRIRARV